MWHVPQSVAGCQWSVVRKSVNTGSDHWPLNSDHRNVARATFKAVICGDAEIRLSLRGLRVFIDNFCEVYEPFSDNYSTRASSCSVSVVCRSHKTPTPPTPTSNNLDSDKKLRVPYLPPACSDAGMGAPPTPTRKNAPSGLRTGRGFEVPARRSPISTA
jgi:hypothetical protein